MHSLRTVQQVLADLRSRSNGLTTKEVYERQQEYGYNELPTKKKSLLLVFLAQFNNVLVYILFAALALSLLSPLLEGDGSAHSFIDASIILLIIILNAVFGFFQEWKAESAIAMLQSLTAPEARVRRDGLEQIIPARALTVGDIVIVEAGDRISADGRIIQSSHCEINESSLTGESLPQTKITTALSAKKPLADQENMVFAGTLLTGGSAEYIVTAIGTSTEIGKISVLVARTKPPETPLQIRLRTLSYRIGVIVLCVTAVITAIGIWQQKDILEILLIAVSLAVSAVPEGLPAVVTICFALGVKRMVEVNALVRRLDALETLGSVTVICSDKTGTITENAMTVIDTWLYKDFAVGDIALAAASCNRAQLPSLGDPTEIGLLTYAKKVGIERLPIEDELVPFNSIDKYMQTRHGTIVFAKGAVEKIMSLCPDIDTVTVMERNTAFAEQGLRVLAFAQSYENKPLQFIGLLAMQDPPRKSVTEAISTAKTAGIRSIMITGDNAVTAQAIAHKVGISGAVVEGVQLDASTAAELREIVREVSIYARVSPENKLQILHALQDQGEVVAMSGDGVNDAPALKGAHVGIAMGKVGTQVAREAASVVLADDHFATIVKAIAEGRRIYDNIKKFILFLLRTNFSALMFIAVTVAMNLPLPYLPLHILWINLVTDGLPALALSIEKADGDIMKRKPRPMREGLLHKQFISLIGYALLGFTVSFTAYLWMYTQNYDITFIRTFCLTLAICFELLFVHSVRSRQPLLQIGLFSNIWLIVACCIPFVLHLIVLYTPLASLFSLTPLGVRYWVVLLPLAASGLIISEAQKYFAKAITRSR